MLLFGLVSCKDSKQDATEHRADRSETPAQSNASSPSTASELLSPAQLEIAAAKGDARAAAILSIKYTMGDGVIVDEKKAIAFAITAADTESPFGWFALSEALSDGTGIGKDETRATDLVKKALPGLKKLAEQNDPWAQFALGVAFEDGKGVAKDRKTAFEWYAKAARHGLAAAQNGLGVTADDQKGAFEWFEKAAAQGNAPAFVNLGVALEQGRGTPKNEQKATEYYQKAADRGNCTGQFMLGQMYSAGIGVATDKRKAIELYTRASEHGLAAAQNSLGVMYSSGTGIDLDHRKAVEWYQKAAAQGDVNGQINLAVAYVTGIGIEKDERKAADWYEKAAIQGEAEAQFKLGFIYGYGRGRTKDEKVSAEWFQKAADHGDPDAEFALGVIYRNGTGVVKDEKAAVEWFKQAAAHGSPDAQEQLGTKPPPIQGVPMERKKMIEHLVIIEGDAGKGSGSIIRLKGNSLIVTNAHVLSGNGKISFRLINSTALNVGTLGIAFGYDLAVITQTTFEGGLEAMQEVEKNVSIGDDVVVLGNSKGAGVVTEIPGKVTGIGPELIEVDAKFVAGNSGSPIIHIKTSKVIGIATYVEVPTLDAITKDSKFTQIRRFGYRLDTVPRWEFPAWDAFQREAKAIADIERKSQHLAALLRDIYADGQGNGHLHQSDDNSLQRYVSEYLQIRNAPPRPIPTPRPVLASEIAAQLSGDALPGENYDTFMARRGQLANLGLLGPTRVARDEEERAEDRRQAEQIRQRLAREMLRDAEATARVEAESQRQREQEKALAEQKSAKQKFLSGIAAEATADIKTLNPDTMTDFHSKELRRKIEFREMLQKEFRRLSGIQDSARQFRVR